MHSPQSESIDAYIKIFPKNVQAVLKKMRAVIREASPRAEETIKYRMPTYTLQGKNLVHFAAFRNHIGFYPTPSPITAFKKELSRYETAKGSIKFPLDKPIPFGLVKKIVKFRVRERIANLKAKA